MGQRTHVSDLMTGDRFEMDGRCYTVRSAFQHPDLRYWDVICEPVPWMEDARFILDEMARVDVTEFAVF